ncbi:hypothetical protein COT52_02175 [candidate division WWE3 bacterium CG08_land_8_20_14_0_20_43_13]|uniref:Uncharacterized protein n=1 Tax=candidate division WWE3 bacterium CG08_land_8_20_14_0_20_43_13 TaxID=1975087 RepID=A0A2H0X742_UNCKA|nr:MAG: hypothetical protein COT52_02175 [candidate division WWE3 bacterium CG08_land_8_20_14_0_20_43_13]
MQNRHKNTFNLLGFLSDYFETALILLIGYAVSLLILTLAENRGFNSLWSGVIAGAALITTVLIPLAKNCLRRKVNFTLVLVFAALTIFTIFAWGVPNMITNASRSIVNCIFAGMGIS